MEKTTVTYLGHSAWKIETPDSFFIFDYDKPLEKNSPADLLKLQGKPAYFFASHEHGDHYNRRLNKSVSQYANMRFITGGFAAAYDNNIALQPRQTRAIADISIATAASTDLGVCYLVQARGVTLFHSGDLANWPDNDETPINYYDEIDYISSKANKTEIAFIPVNTYDWYQDPCLLEGALYAIQKLNPDYVFPMHANGREDLYVSFAKHAAENGIKNRIICMEKPGDSWCSLE